MIHENRHRRGFALLDLFITLSLVTIALSIAATLLSRSMKLTDRAAEADRVMRSFEQMHMVLTRDVRNSEKLSVDRSEIVTSSATWRIEPGRVTREEPQRSSVFEIPDTRLEFAAAPYGIVLSVQSQAHESRRLPIVNVQSWAKESLR